MIQAADRARVVFDCNVLVQAVASDAGASGRALGLLEQNRILVYVSRLVLRELRLVLNYPSVRQKLPGLDDTRIEAFFQRFLFRATYLRHIRHVFDYPRAKQDEPYVDLAAAARAHFLVSYDSDLLSLATDHTMIAKQFRQRFPSIKVLKPAAFLKVLSDDF